MHAPADWYPDPTDRHGQRWWDGRSWSEHVYTEGVQSVDPLTGTAQAALDPDASSDQPDADPAVSESHDVADPAPAAREPAADTHAPDEDGAEADVLRAHLDAIDFFTPRTPPPPLPYPRGDVTAPEDDRADVSAAPTAAPMATATAASSDELDDLDDLEPWSMRADAPEALRPTPSSSGIAGDVFVMTAATVHDLTARRRVPADEADAPAHEQPEPRPEAEVQSDLSEPGGAQRPAADAPPNEAPADGGAVAAYTSASEAIDASAASTSGRRAVDGLGAGDPLGIRGALLGDTDVAAQDRVRVDNRRLLRCALDERSGAVARLGTVVATQGIVELDVVGATRWAHRKRAPSLPLVRTTGSGDVFFADDSQHVTLLQLSGSGSGLVTRAEALLAFDNLLGWGVEHAGDPELAPDLLTVQVHGDGWIALLSDGEPIALPTEGRPTFVDLHALVAWSGALRMRVIRSGPTQDVQVAFEGHGVVIVQPSPGTLLD